MAPCLLYHRVVDNSQIQDATKLRKIETTEPVLRDFFFGVVSKMIVRGVLKHRLPVDETLI